MNEWTPYFNRIYVISLPEDTERLKRTTEILKSYEIGFQVVSAKRRDNGEEGIKETILEILRGCKHMDRILIFEDDVDFVINPNMVMPRCVNQLKKIDWHLFYLGPNTHRPFKRFDAPNILNLEDAYGLHATAYSKAGMEAILSRTVTDPIDVFYATQIQTLGKSYCVYPLIATQRSCYSNIQKKHMDQSYIEERFYRHIKHLL